MVGALKSEALLDFTQRETKSDNKPEAHTKLWVVDAIVSSACGAPDQRARRDRFQLKLITLDRFAFGLAHAVGSLALGVTLCHHTRKLYWSSAIPVSFAYRLTTVGSKANQMKQVMQQFTNCSHQALASQLILA